MVIDIVLLIAVLVLLSNTYFKPEQIESGNLWTKTKQILDCSESPDQYIC